MTVTKRAARRLTPSNSAVAAGAGGAVLAPLVTAGLMAAGVPVTPEMAAAMGPALGFLFAYFTRGGRKDEPQ